MLWTSVSKSKKILWAAGLICVAILINLILSKLVLFFEIPIYADCIGTIIAAMLGGTLPAVLVGFCSNAINGISKC